ncbi:XRE family transcriptional regulator [Streptacidiphilus sp. EB129]|uniref:XRE family transcriptional regulator n=1 Tax=Streptacidiphilus sp. EB129 TaxID=3156262 RepID=UPI0035170EC9
MAAPVPFDPRAAWEARQLLGLSPQMVARAMASHGIMAVPPQVMAWEAGELLPSEPELVALARSLWCTPGQLMGGRAASVRDYRLALDLPQEEVARQLALTPREYAQLEGAARWSGSPDQTYLLAVALRLTPRALVAATGRTEELQDLLQRAIDGRWQAQVKALMRLVPTLPRERIEYALRVLHDEGMTAGALWAGDAVEEAAVPPGPEEALEQFWLLIGE